MAGEGEGGNEGGNDNGGNAGGTGGGGGQQQEEWKPPASQADLDRIVGERLARERAKYGDYDDLKKKATQFDELQAASKTDVEKEREAREAAERTAAEATSKANAKLVRAEIISLAADLGVRGAAAYALLVDAGKIGAGKDVFVDDNGDVVGAKSALEDLVKSHDYLKAGEKNRGDGDGGARGSGSGGGSMDDFIRRQVKR